MFQNLKLYALAVSSLIVSAIMFTITITGFCALVGSTSILTIIAGFFFHIIITTVAMTNLNALLAAMARHAQTSALDHAEALNDQWLKEHAS